MKYLRTLIMTLLLVSVASSSWCGWWIFGQSKDEVNTSYLQMNGMAFDELGEKVTVYKDVMENGEILIKGKASAGKNKIALVEVSTDGQATWSRAELSDNGAFNYRFTPDVGKTYNVVVKITDTSARTNNFTATKHEIVVSNQNVRKLVEEALRRLINAYQTKNATAFMGNISNNFAGDAVNLDRAIRRDFSLFDNITLNFTLNNIANSGGKLAVSISYNRSLYATRSNTNYRDRGNTDFTFTVADKQLKVASMKNPLIFGLSDAANVATGNSPNDPNLLVISVDENGTVSTVAFKDLTAGTTLSNSACGYSGVVTLKTYANGDKDILWDFDNIVLRKPSGYSGESFLNISNPAGSPTLGQSCMTYKDLGTVPISSINASNIPKSGYSACGPGFITYNGHTYSMTNADGTVKVVYIQSVSGVNPTFTIRASYLSCNGVTVP